MAVATKLGALVGEHPLDSILLELGLLRSAGLYQPDAFLEGFSTASATLPEAPRLAAAAALAANGAAGPCALLVAAFGTTGDAAAALQRGSTAAGSKEAFADLFVALLRTASSAAIDGSGGDAGCGGSGVLSSGGEGEGDPEARDAAWVLQLLSAAADSDEALHAAMLSAVHTRLQSIDEPLAHSWTLREVGRLLNPIDGGGWRAQSWWREVLPDILACIEPDELLGALTPRLPVAAGAGLAALRAAAGLAGALLTRSPKAAKQTIERMSGGITDALARDDQGALQSILLIARRVMCPDDYKHLITAAAHKARSAAAAAAAAAGAAGTGAASGAAGERTWLQLAAAVRAVNAGAPRGVLQAHLTLLNGLASEWKLEGHEAFKAVRNDLIPLLKACIQELDHASSASDSTFAHMDPSERQRVETGLQKFLTEFSDSGATRVSEHQARSVVFNRRDFERATLPMLMAAPDDAGQAALRYKYLKTLAADPRIRGAVPRDAPSKYAQTCAAVGFDVESDPPPSESLIRGTVGAVAAAGDTAVGRLQMLLDRLPLQALRPGAGELYCGLLERIEGQLRVVLAEIARAAQQRQLKQQQQQQQQQQGLQQQGQQPKQQQQRGISQERALKPVDGNAPAAAAAAAAGPQGVDARDPKRQRLAEGGSARAGGSSSSTRASPASSGPTPELLVQWLLQTYMKVEEKAAAGGGAVGSGGAAAAAAGGASSSATVSGGAAAAPAAAGVHVAAADQPPWWWRSRFAAMLQRVPELHAPLFEAIIAAAEAAGGGQPAQQAAAKPPPAAGAAGQAEAAAARRGAAMAGLLVQMCSCEVGLEAVADAGSSGGNGGECEAGGTAAGEMQLVQSTRPRLAWSHAAMWPSSAHDGSGGGNGFGQILHGEGEMGAPEGKLPAVAWPQELAVTTAAASHAPQSGAKGEAPCMLAPGPSSACAVMARARLSSAAHLCCAAAFWYAYLEHAASLGWWCTADPGSSSLKTPFACESTHWGLGRRPPQGAVIAFVPPELPGLLAWLEARLPACSGAAASDVVAAAQAACRTALYGPICAQMQLQLRRGGSNGGLGARRGSEDDGDDGSTPPALPLFGDAARWEARALSDGLPLPPAALDAAAALVVQSLRMMPGVRV